MKIKINSIFGNLLFEGDFENMAAAVIAAIKSGADLSHANLSRADLYGANLSGSNLYGADLSRADLSHANLSRADFSGANLYRANLYRANLSHADLSYADLSRANLYGANLSGANLYGADLSRADEEKKTVEKIRVFTGLYKHQVWSVLFQDGSRWVRMGCLFKSLEQWEKIGIRKSNENEFPDNGSPASEERATAFEFAKSAVLKM